MAQLDIASDATYEVHHQILKPADYRVAHSRPRIYIVGIRKDIQKQQFKYPRWVPCISVEDILEPLVEEPTMEQMPVQDTAKNSFKYWMEKLVPHQPLQNMYCIDTDASYKVNEMTGAYEGRCNIMKGKLKCLLKFPRIDLRVHPNNKSHCVCRFSA